MYRYNFYFPGLDVNAHTANVDLWPFNPELKFNHGFVMFHSQYYGTTPANGNTFTDNAAVVDYIIQTEKPHRYYYYVSLDMSRLKQINLFAGGNTNRKKLEFRIPSAVKRDVEAGNAKIILDNCLEGFEDKRFNWNALWECTQMDPTGFVFVTGDKSLNTSSSIPTIYRNTWEKKMSYTCRNNSSRAHVKKMIEHISSKRTRPFYALSLNRLMRAHRIALVKRLTDFALQDKVNYSFGIVTHHGSDAADANNWNQQAHNQIVRHTSNIFQIDEQEIHDWLAAHGEHNIAQEPQLNLHINHASNFEDAVFQAYAESYFSIVAETHYETDTVFQSEKIFKPVMMLQPFVAAGEVGTIREMRNLGYDVFDDIINHKYDTEQDHRKRIDTLLREVDRLCNFSKSRWDDIMVKILPRLIKNYEHLKTASIRYNKLHDPLYRGETIMFPSHH